VWLSNTPSGEHINACNLRADKHDGYELMTWTDGKSLCEGDALTVVVRLVLPDKSLLLNQPISVSLSLRRADGNQVVNSRVVEAKFSPVKRDVLGWEARIGGAFRPSSNSQQSDRPPIPIGAFWLRIEVKVNNKFTLVTDGSYIEVTIKRAPPINSKRLYQKESLSLPPITDDR
jgi:hypothetical protein